MSNIYYMSGKKKVVMEEKKDKSITYKEIMQIIIENATEEGCKNIFTYGGIDLCPSNIFGNAIIDEHQEQDNCNYKNVNCTECWTNAVKQVKSSGIKIIPEKN